MRSQLLVWILTAFLSNIPSKWAFCASWCQRNPKGSLLSANSTNLRTKQHSSCVLEHFCLPLQRLPSPLPLESSKLNKCFVVDKGVHTSWRQKGGLGCWAWCHACFTHTGELDCELRKLLSSLGFLLFILWTEDRVIINCRQRGWLFLEVRVWKDWTSTQASSFSHPYKTHWVQRAGSF